MKYQYWVLVIFVCYCFHASGQINESALPLSVIENLPAVTCFEDLPVPDSLSNLNESDSAQRSTDQFHFAYPINTHLNPDNSGVWTKTPGGTIWRLGIRSEKALSLYITLQYLLSPGTQVFVYGPNYQDLRGAFTHKNNNAAGRLSISPIQGDKLIIELNVPNSQALHGDLTITKVYHGHRTIFKDSTLKSLKNSQANNCDEDINCANGKYWQTEKRSVCKIIYNGGMATGTLIGNTSKNSTPYLLTANHVISSEQTAAEAIFIMNYETTACTGEVTSKVQSLSGATLIATTDRQVDFTLLKPYEKPPMSYQPFYAGWDARNNISEKSVCIHHPFGNYKQIAIEYHPITNEDIGKGFDANSTWKVSHWEIGTTELGSSGAPLFNEQHRIIGTLTGGRSSCDYPRDDYFTKFGFSWDSYPDSSNQLKYWLDSAQTGQLSIAGYDPYGFNPMYCDTAWNFFNYDRIGLSGKGLDWGWISGHNSAGYTRFAEHFKASGTIQIAGVYLHVAKAYHANPLANIELKIWDGDYHPEEDRFTKLVFLKDLQPDKVNYIPFDTVLSESGSFFIGYEVNYTTPIDTFALYHALERDASRPSSMQLYKDTWYKSEDPHALGIYTSLGIGISECYGKTMNPVSGVLNVYPNPCTNSIIVDVPDETSIQKVNCHDFSGRPMAVNFKQTEESNTVYFHLRPGAYILQVITSEKFYTAKFIVSQ